MKNISLKIITVGNRKVPDGWEMNNKIKVQRLYYIKSGKGSLNDGKGGRIPFEAGRIYIQPYNLEADFKSDRDDPIDHVYYDFLSTPPIISSHPIVYSTAESSTVSALIKATEAFCGELTESGIIGTKTNYVPPHMLNNDSSFGNIFRGILSTLLMTLSFKNAIPFSEDSVIVNVLETVRKNYKDPITVTGLADAAGYEVHYFIRRFKHTMGMTPYSYLRAYRLIKAAELIEGGMSITEASELVGYDTPTALSRALSKAGLKKNL